MIVAEFDSGDEARGFQLLLRDLESIESLALASETRFAVEVLRPADFRAGLVYFLYYVKGLSFESVIAQSRAIRMDILAAHLVHYAVANRRWHAPEPSWCCHRLELDAEAIAKAQAKAEREFRRGRPSVWARLFRRAPHTVIG